MIKIRQNGDFSKTMVFFSRLKNLFDAGILDKYGKEGVEALSKATPVDSGKTAESWRYEIKQLKRGMKIEFHNDNIVNGINIAILIQYGHHTKTGGWVVGKDYINPAVRPVFDRMSEEISRKVKGK